jgi:hypothetical protein
MCLGRLPETAVRNEKEKIRNIVVFFLREIRLACGSDGAEVVAWVCVFLSRLGFLGKGL